jgi:hypothetical protein
MQAIAIFNALLLASAPVTALVGARVFPIEAPQSAAQPLIVVDCDDDSVSPTFDAQASPQTRVAYVSLYLSASTASQLGALCDACATACKYQRGTIAGYEVSSTSDGDIDITGFNRDRDVWNIAMRFSLVYRR